MREMTGMTRRLRLAAAGACAVLAAACASAPVAKGPTGSGGGSRARIDGDPQVALRRALATRDTSLAVRAIREMPGDTLLRLMTWGLTWHRLGDYEASNRALEQADRMAEDRYTKSIRQSIGAALLNDNAMDFVPGAHERAFLHYYGMMNYLLLGDEENALVEARAANVFLARYSRENGARSFTNDGTVEYLAGLLHMGSDDRNDAVISFRKAHAAFRNYQQNYGITAPRFLGEDLARMATRLGAEDVASSAAKEFGLKPAELRTKAGYGTLLVLVENGSIARREEQKVYIPVLAEEVEALKDGGAEAALTVGLPILDRTLTLFSEAGKRGGAYGSSYQDGMLLAGVELGADFVTMAWPRYVLDQNGAREVTVIVDSTRQQASLMDDLSAIAARSFEEERPRIVRRMVFRGLSKYALAKMAEKKAEDQGGAFGGFLAKVVTQGIAAKTEKADVRSWSALPGEILAARFTLPAGVHRVAIELQDGDGIPRTVDLGQVKIAANKVAVRSQYVTGTWSGATERFATALAKVDFAAAQDTAMGIAQAEKLAADTLPRRALASNAGATGTKAKARKTTRQAAKEAADDDAPQPATRVAAAPSKSDPVWKSEPEVQMAAAPVSPPAAVASAPAAPATAASSAAAPVPAAAAPVAAGPVAPAPEPVREVVPDTSDYLQRVNEAGAAQQYARALQLATAGSSRFPQNGTLLYLKGNYEYRTGQAPAAKQSLDRLMKMSVRVPGAAMLAAQVSAEVGATDDVVSVLKAEVEADGTQRAAAVKMLTSLGQQAYRSGASSKRREELHRAVTYLSAADAMTPDANNKFMAAVSAFSLTQIVATSLQTTQTCAETQEGKEAMAVVSATLPEGGPVNPAVAKQITDAMGAYQTYFDEATKRYCK